LHYGVQYQVFGLLCICDNQNDLSLALIGKYLIIYQLLNTHIPSIQIRARDFKAVHKPGNASLVELKAYATCCDIATCFSTGIVSQGVDQFKIRIQTFTSVVPIHQIRIGSPNSTY
jgi:hypothetical protein